MAFNMDINQKIGLAIIQLRKEQGISQYDLAQKAKLSFRYLSDIEGGKRDVSITIMEKISNGLRIKLSDLMELIEQKDQLEATNNTMAHFGSRVAELRESRGLTQIEFAKITGIGIRFLKDIESGVLPISIPVIEVIARELGVGISELFS